MILQEFIDSPLRNVWLRGDGIEIYVRKGVHANYPGACLDIANVSVRDELQRQGIFSRWLAEAETLARSRFEYVYIENVMNEFLPAFLVKQGYIVHRGFPDSYVKKLGH